MTITRGTVLVLLTFTACDPIILGDLAPDTASEDDGASEATPDADDGGGDPGGDDEGPDADVGSGDDEGDPSDGDPTDSPDDGDGDGGFECDPFLQDCPDGEKCMPWDDTGGDTWNATRCAPVADDAGSIGEACIVEGSGTSGIDSCVVGAICFDVDPETNEGVCAGLCLGSPDAPVCLDPATVCVADYAGSILDVCLEP